MKNHKKTGFWYRAIARILAAGAVGTLIMSIPMYYGPIFHLPLWPVPHLLAAMLGTPVATGWLIHFAIGWIFTALYVFIRSRGMLRSRPWLLITCYIVFIYLVAVGS
ncbi:MAG: hypothetical protein JST76_06765, partial [Bacteroidetes bacterium]|nr:hypothetical protein [Bacteroidota bacterium]